MAEPAGEPLDQALVLLARRAVSRLADRMSRDTPELAQQSEDWMRSLSTAEPDDYFTHPEAFPMLQLPVWLEASITATPDETFQSEIAYSTVCGYYFVRMLDDLMDDEHPPPSVVLPALIVFHTEFQCTYQRLLPADSPFWGSFTRFSYDAAETASADAGLEAIDLDQFLRVSSRKIAGAKIPIAAVAHRYGQLDTLESWANLVDLLGRWHQMRNDVLGWVKDRKRGRATYFLSEAKRRARIDDSAPQWIAREGLGWAATQLDEWMDELLSLASGLGSPPLLAYLEHRRHVAAAQWLELQADLAVLATVAGSLSRA